MAVPHPRIYFLASQLQHIAGCGSSDPRKDCFRIMLTGAPHRMLIEVLEANSFAYKCPTIDLLNKVWRTTKALLGYLGISEFAPLWHNKNLPEVEGVERCGIWERQGITRLVHLYEGNNMKSFLDLRQEFNIPNNTFFKYLQIRHAIQTQFKSLPLIRTQTPVLSKIAQKTSTKGFISELYNNLGDRVINQKGTLKSRERWERDLGPITQERWNRILSRGVLVSIAPAQRLSHLFLLHRVYYTPKKMFQFGWKTSDQCPRCNTTGDLVHMFWRCPKLFRYWTEVISKLNNTFGASLTLDARTCLLGDMEDDRFLPGTLEGVLRGLFQARKIIAQRWQVHEPPSVGNWIGAINRLIESERVAFIKQGNYKRLEKVWGPWLRCTGLPP